MAGSWKEARGGLAKYGLGAFQWLEKFRFKVNVVAPLIHLARLDDGTAGSQRLRTVYSPVASQAPRVSILIVTLLRDPTMLGRCLTALRRHLPQNPSSEVTVLVQGGSDLATLENAGAHANVLFLRSRVNLGFGAGCNRIAREARGEFLVFLNDDAEVQPGWLEALVETADRHPEAAAVGSRILFPDGTIQEEGAILWSDGSTLGVGRGEPADSLHHQFLRRVDYCSACSLLVRRDVFDAIGGFDEGYFPAYYEDVDLCLAIQRFGKCVVFQPRSTIVHHESQSTTVDFRDFLVLRNRRRLVEKWSAELEKRSRPFPPSPIAVERAVWRARRFTRRVLLIDDRPPQREAGSGFGVLLDAIERLVPLGFAFSVLATDVVDGNLVRLMDLGVEVLRDPVLEVLRKPEALFDIVVVSRPNNLERHAADIRKYQPHAKLVYFAEALYSRRMDRQANLTESLDERRRLAAEADRMRAFESTIRSQVDRIVAISLTESEFLHRSRGECTVHTISPLAGPVLFTEKGFAERSGVIFVPGWLGGEASPNTDAFHWFADRVLPLVQDRIPDVGLRVTGTNPPLSVRRRNGGAIALLGHVPDLGKVYESARIAVVPARYGSGVKIKCAEALRYGVPVVATSVGAEGMGLEESGAVDVAGDPEEFAKKVVELYTGRERWERQRETILRVVAKMAGEASDSWLQIFDLAE